MFKRLSQEVWTCSRCLRQQQQQQQQQQRTIRRNFGASGTPKGTATATLPGTSINPISRASPNTVHDDDILRRIFDSPNVWKEFSARAQNRYGGKSAGLFQNPYLARPEGFLEYANITLRKCQDIVAKILAYDSIDGLKRIVRDFDRLSDLLCRVIDISDFVRLVHPDSRVQAAASQAWSLMYEYMNVLNTTTGLDSQLKLAIATPEASKSWSEQERKVAHLLLKDFSRSAIDFGNTQRQAFVSLSNEVAQLGNDFQDLMSPQQTAISFQSSKLKGMDPQIVRQLTRFGTVTLPTVGLPANMALTSVEDEDTRHKIYMANKTSESTNLQRLDQMLRRRAELANLSGYASYGHMTLEDKMARSPEAVTTFLNAVADVNAPRAQGEVQELLALKQCGAGSANSPAELNAWDRDFYAARMKSMMRSKARTADSLSAYFSLGTVMQGISRLLHRLYGIRLAPKETLPGETGNPDVRRLDVIDDTEGHIATMYCDLFQRSGKSPNPAHYTLRCSRRISDEELQEAGDTLTEARSPFTTAREAVNDGQATYYNSRDGDVLYQVPIIGVICDYTLPVKNRHGERRPALLNFQEVTTLWHEMGHAVHSICARTTFQNVSGTRVATDLAELPSIFMENFASAPEVLAMYARHWETDAPLDPSLILDQTAADRRRQGHEIEHTILHGVFDQRCHSSAPLTWLEHDMGTASTKIWHEVHDRYSAIPEPSGTSSQGYFGHIVGYGATYYSYLFDRVLANKIWRDVFKKSAGGVLDPAAGHLFREELLRHGGARDGWRCLAGVLKDETGVLADGGEAAMEEVGSWGIHD
nr:mitochondrial intermediate peptidase [Quercus suber]